MENSSRPSKAIIDHTYAQCSSLKNPILKYVTQFLRIISNNKWSSISLWFLNILFEQASMIFSHRWKVISLIFKSMKIVFRKKIDLQYLHKYISAYLYVEHKFIVQLPIQFMNEIPNFRSLWTLQKNVCKAHLSSWQIISLQCYWNSSFRTYSFFCAVLSFLGNKNLYQVVETWQFFFFIYRTRAIITRGLYIFYSLFILKSGLYYRQFMD